MKAKEILDYQGLRVMCNNYICLDRGNYGRCYMHIYVNCSNYRAWEKIAKTSALEHMSEKQFNRVRRML